MRYENTMRTDQGHGELPARGPVELLQTGWRWFTRLAPIAVAVIAVASVVAVATPVNALGLIGVDRNSGMVLGTAMGLLFALPIAGWAVVTSALLGLHPGDESVRTSFRSLTMPLVAVGIAAVVAGVVFGGHELTAPPYLQAGWADAVVLLGSALAGAGGVMTALTHVRRPHRGHEMGGR